MIIAEIKGNLLDTEIPNIAHGVNCQGVMGSGVAKAIYTKYPEAKEQYHILYNGLYPENISNTKDLLGIVQDIFIDESKTVFNCFTQDFYGNDGKLYVDYDAIKECFRVLTNEFNIKELAIPKIGCGLAGGDWEIVKKTINDVTGDLMDVTVYYLQEKL